MTPFNGRTGATFVSSGGLIDLKGNVNIRPYSGIPERLVLFTNWKTGNNRCDAEVLKLSGNCNHFDRVVYVPKGSYRASGEGNGNDHARGSCVASPSNSYAGHPLWE
ncbi:MAG: hypothetical protein LC739_10865 [Actinobacteria bacterium]|nr:hypothetical protein [Actinomycetota bacterium]